MSSSAWRSSAGFGSGASEADSGSGSKRGRDNTSPVDGPAQRARPASSAELGFYGPAPGVPLQPLVNGRPIICRNDKLPLDARRSHWMVRLSSTKQGQTRFFFRCNTCGGHVIWEDTLISGEKYLEGWSLGPPPPAASSPVNIAGSSDVAPPVPAAATAAGTAIGSSAAAGAGTVSSAGALEGRVPFQSAMSRGQPAAHNGARSGTNGASASAGVVGSGHAASSSSAWQADSSSLSAAAPAAPEAAFEPSSSTMRARELPQECPTPPISPTLSPAPKSNDADGGSGSGAGAITSSSSAAASTQRQVHGAYVAGEPSSSPQLMPQVLNYFVSPAPAASSSASSTSTATAAASSSSPAGRHASTNNYASSGTSSSGAGASSSSASYSPTSPQQVMQGPSADSFTQPGAPKCKGCNGDIWCTITSKYGLRRDCYPCGLTGWKGGEMVTQAVRTARKAANAAFDRLWKDEGQKFYGDRAAAYEWLSTQMDMSSADAHMAHMDEAQARKVIAIAETEMASAAASATAGAQGAASSTIGAGAGAGVAASSAVDDDEEFWNQAYALFADDLG